jgi:hypothetical protein
MAGSRVWHPALRRAGLRAIRIHDARHTFASIRLAAGINPATASKLLGYSNVAVMHAIYTHAIESAEEDPNDEEKRARYRGKWVGCRLVAEGAAAPEPHTEVVDSMVAVSDAPPDGAIVVGEL